MNEVCKTCKYYYTDNLFDSPTGCHCGSAVRPCEVGPRDLGRYLYNKSKTEQKEVRHDKNHKRKF